MGNGGKRLRGWLAFLLAVQIAIPLPVVAQTPSLGIQSSSGVQALEEPDLQSPGRTPSARTPRESWNFPTISIAEPQNGTIVTQEAQRIVINFRDPRDELDLTSFRVWVNGVDRTKEFQATSSSATWQPQPGRVFESTQGGQLTGTTGTTGTTGMTGQGLGDGQNTIVASIKNLSGNVATTSSAFIVDLSVLLTTRSIPRSPLERGFLQPPSPPPTEQTKRRAPSEPTISRDLVQYGYEAFRMMLPSLMPAANLPVSPDYRLGPGDSLILYVWSIPGTALYDTSTLTIDRTGSAFLPRIGSIPLQGLTLAEAQEVIRSKVARNYSGFELRLAVGELRAISVYVVGEVARPGTYTVTPFSTVLDALFVAGGPSKMGSLRDVRVTQTAGPVREVDLYDFLLRGERPTGPMLQAGDTIFVPPIGLVAGVTGEIKRPGIYELRPGTTVGMLLAMAGGPLPAAKLDRVQVERTQGATGKTLLDLPFDSGRGPGAAEMLHDGDLLTVFPGQDFLRNVVIVEGFVRTPGQYQWKPGMWLSDLLTPETILPEAYREKVEVVRVNPDFTREIVLVNLQTLWASRTTPDSAQDLELQPQDRINVRSEVVGPMIVTMTGEVRRPGKYSVNRGERLSSVIGRAGGFLPTAFLRGAVFTREALRRQERQQLERFIDIQNQSNLSEGAALAAGGVASGTTEVSSGVPAMVAQRRELLQSLQRGVVFGRISIQLGKTETEKPGSVKGAENDLELEDGDELNVPQQPKSVSILGAVRNTTAILYKDGESVGYYLNRVGGVTREGDVSQIYILKPDGSALASFVKMRQVEAGDAIIVPFSTDPKIPLIVMVKDVATILGNLAIPFGVILSLLK